MTRFLRIAAILLTAQPVPAAVAGGPILVVVHPARTATIEKSDLRDVYLGTRGMIGGWRVDPVDQELAPEVREGFYRAIAGKTLVEMRVHWAEQIFSGRGRAPRVVANDKAVVEYVLENPDAIGFVSGAADTSGVRILLRVE